MMDGWYDGMGTGGWILMTVFWVSLIAAIVWAGARLFARPGPVDHSDGAGERPGEILQRRLASGEIDAETYDALSEKLRAAR
jgi:putative membrane protein